jgi:HEPN domain-containing protein
MKPNPADEARRWFEQAQDDIAAAVHMTNGGFHNHTCFLAQQAVEKALKAFLLSRGAWDVRGHSVADLCSEAAKVHQPFAALVDIVAPLDKFYIPTRYPNGLPGGTPSKAFDRGDAERALETARRAMSFIAEQLPIRD